MTAGERIEEALRESPSAVELARGLALAVRIEPALLRGMRLHWLASAGPEAEGDLWFGPLVEIRTPTNVTLDDDVRQLLLDQLADQYREDKSRVQAARTIVQKAHAGLSPALQLEEDIAWYTVQGDAQAIEATIAQVLIAYGNGNRKGLEQWAARAWGRLPTAAQDSAAGAALLEIARSARLPVRLTRSAGAAPAKAETLAAIASRLRTATLAVRRQGRSIEFGDLSSGYSMEVPDTNPRLIEMNAGAHTGPTREWIGIEAGDVVRLEVGLTPVLVRTSAGALYEVPAAQVRLHLKAGTHGLHARLDIDGETRAAEEVRSELFLDPQKLTFQTSGEQSPLHLRMNELFQRIPESIAADLREPAPLELLLQPEAAWWPWELGNPIPADPNGALGLTRVVSRRGQEEAPGRVRPTGSDDCLVVLSLSGFTANAAAEKIAANETRGIERRLDRSGMTVLGGTTAEEGIAKRASGMTSPRFLHVGGWIRFATETDGRVRMKLSDDLAWVTRMLDTDPALPECVAIDCRVFTGAPGELYPKSNYPETLDLHSAHAVAYALDLLRRGVRTVVLALAPLAERGAGAMWDNLYVALAGGETVGAALLSARVRAHQIDPSSVGWALLQLYGDGAWTLRGSAEPAPVATEPSSGWSIARLLDHRSVEKPGLFRISGANEFTLVPVTESELMHAEPLIIFIHGEGSSTRGTFGHLLDTPHAAYLDRLRQLYGDRQFAYEHYSLSCGPIENALQLARALPPGARLHLVAHSAGGLIGELLARAQRIGPSPPFDEADYARLAEQPDDEAALRQLSHLLVHKRLRVERFVCVAAPMRGSVLLWRAISRSTAFANLIPVAGWAVAALLRPATDPKRIPGIAAMYPDAPLIYLINRSEVVTEADLAIVSGTTEKSGLRRLLLGTLFLGSDSDLLIDTHSMYGGAQRVRPAYAAHFSGSHVDHFQYFMNAEVVEAMLHRLERATPGPPWQPLSAEDQRLSR